MSARLPIRPDKIEKAQLISAQHERSDAAFYCLNSPGETPIHWLKTKVKEPGQKKPTLLAATPPQYTCMRR